MTQSSGPPWPLYALAALLVGAIAAAILVVGPASSGNASSATRTIAAQRGVVQSTVSGSGNIEPSSQLDLGFETSGTVTQIDVSQGEQVAHGQLIATLDPQSAEVALEQTKATLQSAEASLSREEETDGEGSAQSESARTSATGATASAASAPAANSKRTTASKPSSGTGTGSGSTASGSTSSTTISTATREANLASARAAVKSDRLSVESAEQSVADTRLVAPQSGTIVSLSGEVGETVSGGGTSRASSAAASASSSGVATGAEGSARGSSSTASSSTASSSSGTAFAVLSDLSSMKLVVPLSESEVGEVKRGQPATVTVEALKGVALAAHVAEVAALPTSNSGVVSYDVTFDLDQLEAGVKAGMSASAEVVVSQAEGVNVPTSAISGGGVTVIRDGKQVRQAVTTGLAGNSSTIVLGGLKAGERVVLPLSTSSGTSSLLSRLAGRGALGGGLGGAGGAGVGVGVGGGFARRSLGVGPGG